MPLPARLAAREVSLHYSTPLPFMELTGLIATLAGVPVEVEERPARVAGGAVRLPDPPGVRLAFEGRLPALLNLVAARSGYDWTWARDAIVFYRYGDVDWRAPETAAEAPAVRTGDGGVSTANRAAPPWVVDPAHHESLLDVLEDWGARAGWSVVWNVGRRYGVRAGASFGGAFLDAVDRLLAAPATRRFLVAFAHEPNRHLVIEPAGAVR